MSGEHLSHIAIIGLGNMGSSLAQRWSKQRRLFLYDHHLDRSQRLQEMGCGVACSDAATALRGAEAVVLAIKPQSLEAAARRLSPLLDGQLLISLLAGTPLARLRRFFVGQRLVRMMPNLPMRCGAGVIGLTAEDMDDAALQGYMETLCRPLGLPFWLPEAKMDAFTALAGSGPAFVCTIVESMIDAAIAMGFSATEGRTLALAMAAGSVQLLRESEEAPAALRQQVSSPGGTTIAGQRVLEHGGLRSVLIETFLACYARAQELTADA